MGQLLLVVRAAAELGLLLNRHSLTNDSGCLENCLNSNLRPVPVSGELALSTRGLSANYWVSKGWL